MPSINKRKSLIALGAVSMLGLAAYATPAQADSVHVSLNFGYPQPVVQEVVRAHPECGRHRYSRCRSWYHEAYGRHYRGRHDPHWNHHR
jgi:hypothetical protein